MKTLFTILVVLTLVSHTFGQDLSLQNELGQSFVQEGDPVKFAASFELKQNSQEGTLNLKATIDEHWHLFSVTQPKGGPMRSKISVIESKQFELIGEFRPDQKPKTNKESTFDVPTEEHEGTVVWSAPIKLAPGVDPKSLTIQLTFNGQVCESKPTGTCIPLFDKKSTARFSGFKKSQTTTASQPFQMGKTHAQIVARAYTEDGKNFLAGKKFKLEFKVIPSGKYHVYAHEPGKCDFMATRIGFTDVSNMKISGPTASSEVHLDDSLGIDLKYHEGEVSWTFDVAVPENVESKTYPIVGLIGLQTCDDEQCDPPAGAQFAIQIPVGTSSSANATFEKSSYGKAKKSQTAFNESKAK